MTTELGPVLLRGIPFGSARHIRRDIKDMPDTDPPAVQAGTSSAARSHPPTPAPKLTLVLALGAGAGGALLAVQSRINGALAHALGPGHAITAALISFAGGLALLCAVVALSRHRRAALAELRRARVPAWSYLGGLAGVAFVSSAAYATPVTGVAFLMVCVIVGQMIGGLVIDAWGIGPGGKRPITARRLVAALMAVGAVVVNANGHLPAGAGAALLPLLTVVGALLSFQQAANGRVSAASGSPAVATFVSFSVSTVVLMALAISAPVFGAAGPAPNWLSPGQAWMFVGGACGVLFVLLSTIAVGPLGVLRVAMSVIAGQFTGAVALDLLAPASSGLQTPTAIAAVLTFGAVVLANKR